MPLKPAQMPLRLVPEVLDAVDMMAALADKAFAVVNPPVTKLGNIQHVIGGKTVGVDDAVRRHFLPDDRQQSLGLGIRDDRRKDLAAPLQQAKNGYLARRRPATLTLAPAAKITFVRLHFAR